MNVVITCGPSFEPVDGARRLTNHSTGTLGLRLAARFRSAGHRVFCFKGEGATCPEVVPGAVMHPFSTNADLVQRLKMLSGREKVHLVLHVAALCDFKVAQVLDASGKPLASRKFSSRAGELHLVLRPAMKVLPKLRNLFPNARIVGWKFELNGRRSDVLGKARDQIHSAGSDACVVNGLAWGPGYGFCLPDGSVEPCRTADALGERLLSWAEGQVVATKRMRRGG